MSTPKTIRSAIAAASAALLVLASCTKFDSDDGATPAPDGGTDAASPRTDAQGAPADAGLDAHDGATDGDAPSPDYEGGKGPIICTPEITCQADTSYCCVSATVAQGCVPRSGSALCINAIRCNSKDNCLAGNCFARFEGTTCRAAPLADEHVACLRDEDCTTPATCRTGCFINDVAQGICLENGAACF